MKKVLIYLDTGKVANPFDLLLAFDAGYDAVLPYTNINEDNVDYIVHNSIFARGREGLDNTVFLVGGSLDASESVFRRLKRMLKDPFKMSVVWDPNGACTTAAATVAKIEQISDNIRHEKATILAGTGPIGQISAILLSKLGAEVTITSRDEAKAKSVANKLSDYVNQTIKGEGGGNLPQRCSACKDAKIILATGAIGAQLLDSDSLSKLSAEIIADVNAVQPYGVEGIDPDMSGDKIEGKKLLGSCAIGDLKNLVEREILQRAVSENRFFDYNDALMLARELR